MFTQFGLVLMVTHACNLRCTYCYTGKKDDRAMPVEVGRRAIERAMASLSAGGTFDLSFFGGEPLLQVRLITEFVAFARERCQAAGVELSLHMTTNGTVDTPQAWRVMTQPDMDLAVSCDGAPLVHDRHRSFADGRPSSARVAATIGRLMAAGKDVRVVAVVRPDTLDKLPESIRFLQQLGVRRIVPSLDLWATWSEEDECRLEQVIARCADLWRDGLPGHNVSWFDEKMAHIAHLEMPPTSRCGFGHGEVAVAPSGRLYPCERLIGEDRDGDPMALAGHVDDGGDDLLGMAPTTGREDEGCIQCAMLSMCNTMCRCSNYVRSGDTRRPDRLLCRWNQRCLTETARVLKQMAPAGRPIGGAEHEPTGYPAAR